jgi:ERCC4-type nuclease
MMTYAATPMHCVFNEPRTTASHIKFRLGDRACTETTVPCNHNRYADLWWSTEQESYGVELKSTSDLLGSLWSREHGDRLEGQLQGCRETYDRVVLGIHGLLWDNPEGVLEVVAPLVRRKARTGHAYIEAPIIAETGHRLQSVNGFLWSIEHPEDGGQPVDVLWRPTKEQLLDAVVDLYEWSQKVEHKTFNRRLSRGTRTEQRDLNALIALGLSEPQARGLLEAHGSFRKVINLSDQELLAHKGVGKETVKRLRETLGDAA